MRGRNICKPARYWIEYVQGRITSGRTRKKERKKNSVKRTGKIERNGRKENGTYRRVSCVLFFSGCGGTLTKNFRNILFAGTIKTRDTPIKSPAVTVTAAIFADEPNNGFDNEPGAMGSI